MAVERNITLEQGSYNFKHIAYGDVSLTIRENLVSLRGERQLKNGKRIETFTQSSSGLTREDAISSLPASAVDLIANYQAEREAAEQLGQSVVFVSDLRRGLTVEQRVTMGKSGEIPAGSRLLKADAF